MVYVFGIAEFPATQSLQLALCAAQAASLQLGPQTTVAVAQVVDLAPDKVMWSEVAAIVLIRLKNLMNQKELGRCP
jgi:hypothetical protein